MLGFCPLASGSKGNCIYVGSEETKLLIDAGLSTKMIEMRLAEIGVKLSDINAILVTHEHTDHIRALPVLTKKYDIPIFANSETAKAIFRSMKHEPRFKIFTTGETFVYGDIDIHPFSIQHDAVDPVMFTLSFAGHKLGVCTDLGFVTTLVVNQLHDCDYMIIESNHQPSMVHASARSFVYKQRVLGRLGHISNEECARLLLEVYHPHLKHVHLAHLSEECNCPELAQKLVRETLEMHGKTIDVSLAHQHRVSKPIAFEGSISR